MWLQSAHKKLFPHWKLWRPPYRKAEDVLKNWGIKKLGPRIAARCLLEIILYVPFQSKENEVAAFQEAREKFSSMFKLFGEALNKKETFKILEDVFIQNGLARWTIIKKKLSETFQRLEEENKEPKKEAQQT